MEIPLGRLKSRQDPWKVNSSTTWLYSDVGWRPSYLLWWNQEPWGMILAEAWYTLHSILGNYTTWRQEAQVWKVRCELKQNMEAETEDSLQWGKPPSDCFQLTFSCGSGGRCMVKTKRAIPAVVSIFKQLLATSWLCWRLRDFQKQYHPITHVRKTGPAPSCPLLGN